MLQAVLKDRFNLTIRRETRELPVYSLIVLKNGPKFQEAKPGDTYPEDGGIEPGATSMRGRGHLIGHAVPISSLVGALSIRAGLGRTLQDKTGLTEKYNFTLRWTPGDGQSQASPESAPSDQVYPDLFTAIQEQLGLKLDSIKGPVEVIVIDHVERPSGN